MERRTPFSRASAAAKLILSEYAVVGRRSCWTEKDIKAFIQKYLGKKFNHLILSSPTPTPSEMQAFKTQSTVPIPECEITDMDVLCGRGSTEANRPGNIAYRERCLRTLPAYMDAPEYHKRFHLIELSDRLKRDGVRVLDRAPAVPVLVGWEEGGARVKVGEVGDVLRRATSQHFIRLEMLMEGGWETALAVHSNEWGSEVLLEGARPGDLVRCLFLNINNAGKKTLSVYNKPTVLPRMAQPQQIAESCYYEVSALKCIERLGQLFRDAKGKWKRSRVKTGRKISSTEIDVEEVVKKAWEEGERLSEDEANARVPPFIDSETISDSHKAARPWSRPPPAPTRTELRATGSIRAPSSSFAKLRSLPRTEPIKRIQSDTPTPSGKRISGSPSSGFETEDSASSPTQSALPFGTGTDYMYAAKGPIQSAEMDRRLNSVVRDNAGLEPFDGISTNLEYTAFGARGVIEGFQNLPLRSWEMGGGLPTPPTQATPPPHRVRGISRNSSEGREFADPEALSKSLESLSFMAPGSSRRGSPSPRDSSRTQFLLDFDPSSPAKAFDNHFSIFDP